VYGCSDEKGDPVLTINGKRFYERDIENVLNRSSAATSKDEVKKAIIERFIADELAAQAARKDGLDKSPLVSAQIEGNVRMILADAYYESKLQESGEKELREYYDRNHKRFERASADLSIISIRYDKKNGSVDGRKAAAFTKSQTAYARLLGGEDFEIVASDMTEDKEGRADKGRIGRVYLDQLEMEIAAELAGMQPGAFSKPIVSLSGVHIVRLNDGLRTEAKPYEKVRSQLLQEVMIEKKRELQRVLKEKSSIENLLRWQ